MQYRFWIHFGGALLGLGFVQLSVMGNTKDCADQYIYLYIPIYICSAYWAEWQTDLLSLIQDLDKPLGALSWWDLRWVLPSSSIWSQTCNLSVNTRERTTGITFSLKSWICNVVPSSEGIQCIKRISLMHPQCYKVPHSLQGHTSSLHQGCHAITRNKWKACSILGGWGGGGERWGRPQQTVGCGLKTENLKNGHFENCPWGFINHCVLVVFQF